MKVQPKKKYDNKPSLGNTITPELLVEYLINYSSQNKPVSIKDMCSYFDEKIVFASENGMALNQLDDSMEEDLLKNYLPEKSSFAPQQTSEKQIKRLLIKYLDTHLFAGFFISSSVPQTIGSGKSGKPLLKVRADERVFYVDRPFDEASINLLRDALEVFPYAETYVTYDIISNLNRLTPMYNRREFNPEIVSAVKYKGSYFKNLEEITKAFSSINKPNMYVNKIRFTYCMYDENKKLIEKPGRNGTSERIVNPVKIMWANGYYYLVTVISKEKKSDNLHRSELEYIYINYRIDRMKNVKCLTEKAKIPAEFSTDKYRTTHPIMYAEKNQEHNTIEIQCDKSIINNAIDTFGFDIEISPSADSNNVILTIRGTSLEGVKMWALEYCEKCRILSPPTLIEQMKKAAEHLKNCYL